MAGSVKLLVRGNSQGAINGVFRNGSNIQKEGGVMVKCCDAWLDSLLLEMMVDWCLFAANVTCHISCLTILCRIV